MSVSSRFSKQAASPLILVVGSAFMAVGCGSSGAGGGSADKVVGGLAADPAAGDPAAGADPGPVADPFDRDGDGYADPIGAGQVNLDGLNYYAESVSAPTRTTVEKADVLFVVDESVSMDAINAAVSAGFASMSQSELPSDTIMAVTNMAPAYFTDFARRTFDPLRAFVSDRATPNAIQPGTTSPVNVAKQPGFLRLVSGPSIASFLGLYPGFASRFLRQGCAEGWFRQADVNAQGVSCLVAHSQFAGMATGVEAGVFSLYQTAERMRAAGERLFRDGASANVIFVSDTHEPGAAGYFKAAGGAGAPLSFEELATSLEASSPGVQGVRVHGIVPLPPSGHPRLTGVRTIGALPASLAASKVSAEETNDFAYLPYVARSNGLALHPIGNDWGAALAEMARGITVQTTPLARLARPVLSLLSVSVNGAPIASDRYRIRADRRTVEILPDASWGDSVSVAVQYLSY